MKRLVNQHKTLIISAILALIFVSIASTRVALAGDPPTGVIGPMNPTMYKCVDGENAEIYQPDPFIKRTARRVLPGGALIQFDVTDDDGDLIFDGGPALLDPNFREDYYQSMIGGEITSDSGEVKRDNRYEHFDPQTQTCDNPFDVNFGFDTKDAVLYEGYLTDLDQACDAADGTIVPIMDTLIEGVVYEFHKAGNGEWVGVPSRNVPVVLNGITFNISWGTNDDGYYVFQNLGAGPMVLNLRLPPDAHPINPNVALFSSGLESGKENAPSPFTALLGFYRGDERPEDVSQLKTPDGNFLPFSNQSEIDMLRQCGYLGMPTAADVPNEILEMSYGIPQVGEKPEPSPYRTGIMMVASLGLLALLVIAGGAKAYYRRL
ncbi:hypothetical protein QUF58_13970 [Anaerolineales bacterium HSG24]|nr:hypothetical protein [Anaerolineales bacterium HSG24]